MILFSMFDPFFYPTIILNESDFAGGGEASFYICGGDTASSSIGDAKIDVSSTATTVYGFGFQKDVTVFFYESDVFADVVPGSFYEFGEFEYLPVIFPNVNMWAVSVLKPSGLDSSVSQISDWKLNIIQNVDALVIVHYELDQSSINWLPGSSSARFPDKLNYELSMPSYMMDLSVEGVNANSEPFYEGSASGFFGGQISEVKYVDAPFVRLVKVTVPYSVFSVPIATAEYNPTRVEVVEDFRMWAALEDFSQGRLPVPLQENAWYVQADSDVEDQIATGSDMSTVPSHIPVTSGPIAVDYADEHYIQVVPSDATMITFTNEN